mmetsp:Transcript_6279/g.17601  ORF Transcript_6279/g.17601 Transcript_6279/m.17601 type:complete len:463 (-) Transcript_6279:376-1764(-)
MPRPTDPRLEADAREWIEAVLGQPLGPGSLQEELKSGEVLCRLINVLKPGAVPKITTTKMPFKQMENISAYLQASSALGVPAFESFQTVDLYENKDMLAVVTNLHSLGRLAQKLPGYTGPPLGVKLAEANKRNFTPQQLAEAKAVPTRFGQGSHGGASQAGTKPNDSIVRTHLDKEGLGTGGEPTLLGSGSSGCGSSGISLASAVEARASGCSREAVVESAEAEATTKREGPPDDPPADILAACSISEAVASPGVSIEDQEAEPIAEVDHATGLGATAATASAITPSAPRQPVKTPSGASYIRYEDREAEDGTVAYGLDRELAAKARAKYDPQLESEARSWIEAVIGEPLGAGSMHEELKSGEILCKLVNAIKPGSVPKISTMKTPFKQMENIGNYLHACSSLGVPAFESFQTVDLFENKNMLAVVTNLHALGRVAQRVAGYSGPTIGVKMAEANNRNFTAG